MYTVSQGQEQNKTLNRDYFYKLIIIAQTKLCTTETFKYNIIYFHLGDKMVIAFVLCVTQAGKEKEVLEKLLRLKEVEEAHIVYGEYDVIAKIKLDDLKMLDTFIVDKIRVIEEIQVTSTMISSD